MKASKPDTAFSRFRHRLWTALGAIGLTLIFFIVLPLMQTITAPRDDDTQVRQAPDIMDEPPPDVPEPEPEEEPEQEEPPPSLEEAPPMDLSQMEIALNPGFGGGGWTGGGGLAVDLTSIAKEGNDIDSIVSMADLDQKPRVVYQPGPQLTKQTRRKAPGTVYIIFVVNENGRVVDPKVQKTTDPVFSKPALAAVKQWKFEPGKRKGKAVRFRMRVPITFPKG